MPVGTARILRNLRMTTGTESAPKPPLPPEVRHRAERRGILEYFGSYFWFIFKNVIGWIFILGSPVLGIALPGPGGIPLFLIGFALVTLPGKRRLTSRVMRGRGLPIETALYTFIIAVIAIAVTCGLMWFVSGRYEELLAWLNLDPRPEDAPITARIAALLGVGIIALGVTWVITRVALQIVNVFLKAAPAIRRKVRPWMRKQGLNLLPTRRKKLAGELSIQEDEILEIHERHHRRLRMLWVTFLPWARRVITVGVTIAIFYYMLRPIFREWPQVRAHIMDVSILRLLIASGMFAAFLFVFRVLTWWRILSGFGHTLPLAAATRIWSTSELARYIPLAIWQVLGRIYLVRPYGVRATVCTVSQILELTIFLLANLLIAIGCMLYFGIKNLAPPAEYWLYVAAVLAPVLLILLHPPVFYAVVTAVMRRIGNPVVLPRLGGSILLRLLGWNILGLLWQSIALFVILQGPLGLKLDWWWVLAGAYCLAWCAGFLAVWAPAGIGIRELVFVTAMLVALPDAVREGFAEREVLLGFLAFLSVLLRVWTVVGELIVAAIAYAFDLRGALNLPDAPGRIPVGRMRPPRPADADPAA